jgi:hypothetical protein
MKRYLRHLAGFLLLIAVLVVLLSRVAHPS